MSYEVIAKYFPVLGTVAIVFLASWITSRLIDRNMDRGGWRSMIKGGAVCLWLLFGLFIFIILLPIPANTKENILKVGGLILTAVVAFSSTTVIRDAAAGITMRVFTPFRRGDYLRTDQYFGRVSEIGLVHTELQTEDRSLVTLANGNLLNNSFKTIPSSGTVLSTTVSLGFDVPRGTIEDTLIKAAEAVELENPFVHILELGNFAVTYKVAGLLEDVDNLLTVRSEFRKSVLDHLHEAGVEIVSPNFINRRNIDDREPFIPDRTGTPPEQVDTSGEETEEVIFEKALEAKKVEDLDLLINEMEQEIEELENADKPGAEDRLEKLRDRLEMLQTRRDQLEEQIAEDQE